MICIVFIIIRKSGTCLAWHLWDSLWATLLNCFLMKIHDNVNEDEELHCNQTDYDDHDYDDDPTREGKWMGLQ